MMIVRVISALVFGCFLGLLFLIGVEFVIAIVYATVKIYRIIIDFLRFK